MIIKYKQIALDKKLNTYFISVGDTNYNIEIEEIVPANPTCNCYSVAKAFTVTAIVVSMLSIKFLMAYVKKHDFKVFGYYRIVLGIIVLAYFLILG